MDVDQLLAEGIAAAKAREVERARELLLQVVALDEEREAAWLWLSGLLESRKDRRVCLENVLAINPDNEMARKGLVRLGPVANEVERTETATEERPASDWTDEDTTTLSATAVVDEELPDFLKPPAVAANTSEAQATTPTARPVERKSGDRGDRLLWYGAIGMLLLVCIALAFIAVTTIGDAVSGLELPSIGGAANVDDEQAPLVVGAVHDNLVAYNAQNIDAYMATIHSRSPGWNETRQGMDELVGNFELYASLERADIVSLSSREAEVAFTLVTRKISGPAFRDNRIDGIMILRPEDGRWKIYDQRVDNVTYLDEE